MYISYKSSHKLAQLGYVVLGLSLSRTVHYCALYQDSCDDGNIARPYTNGLGSYDK